MKFISCKKIVTMFLMANFAFAQVMAVGVDDNANVQNNVNTHARKVRRTRRAGRKEFIKKSLWIVGGVLTGAFAIKLVADFYNNSVERSNQERLRREQEEQERLRREREEHERIIREQEEKEEQEEIRIEQEKLERLYREREEQMRKERLQEQERKERLQQERIEELERVQQEILECAWRLSESDSISVTLPLTLRFAELQMRKFTLEGQIAEYHNAPRARIKFWRDMADATYVDSLRNLINEIERNYGWLRFESDYSRRYEDMLISCLQRQIRAWEDLYKNDIIFYFHLDGLEQLQALRKTLRDLEFKRDFNGSRNKNDSDDFFKNFEEFEEFVRNSFRDNRSQQNNDVNNDNNNLNKEDYKFPELDNLSKMELAKLRNELDIQITRGDFKNNPEGKKEADSKMRTITDLIQNMKKKQ